MAASIEEIEMFLVVLLVAFVVLFLVVVSDFKDSGMASGSESVTLDAGGSGLHELAIELSKAFQGGNDTVFYIAIGVTVGIAIDMLARRFF